MIPRRASWRESGPGAVRHRECGCVECAECAECDDEREGVRACEDVDVDAVGGAMASPCRE